MSQPKMQHCFNCGEELGVFVAYYGDVLTCGSPECDHEAREIYRARQEEAEEQAREDGYSRYGGNGPSW